MLSKDDIDMMSSLHGVDVEAEMLIKQNKQSTRKADMDLVQLTNKIITGIELLAEEYGAIPESPDYGKKLRKMSKILARPATIIDQVIRKDIGEQWKAVAAYPRYKISNYGRVIGQSGKVMSTYVDKYGREMVDTHIAKGKHKHLRIRKAVINAFIKPKNGQRVKYLHGQKINTVFNLGIV